LEAVRRRIELACQRAGRSPQDVTMIAVTKTVDAAMIETAVGLGIRDLGENRVQEASNKIRQLAHLQPQPTWHLIGHLQSNKVKSALDLFDIIHSVDSVELAEHIRRRAKAQVPVLLQVNVAGESTKSGFSPSEIEAAFTTISRMPGLRVRGLMTIAPPTSDAERVRPVFRKLREMRDAFHLEHLSMGMTDDFEVAIEEGATFVRIGRAIFGER
ncbi:MAG: YggS family pyridoxal phosphate-dependent enzyme, partial [Dehalococcoidales bacterium]|nr:YggS family pyridoxal phosphate-dependent enzyme [Dehalococcoidales bacterium]